MNPLGGGPVLVLAGHADDETLACGGTLARWAAEGHEVHLAIATDSVTAQYPDDHEAIRERARAAGAASSVLGLTSVTFGSFPDMRLSSVSALDLNAWCDQQIGRVAAQTVLVPWNGDLNDDHRALSAAAKVAARPLPGSSVRAVLEYETLSSSEWGSLLSHRSFMPDVFVDITDSLSTKQSAMACYQRELRDYPHPRSPEAIEALAHHRGSTVGVHAAEAFALVYAVG